MKKKYSREKKICEFQANGSYDFAKIGKMCIDIVQKELFSDKDSRQWTPKKLLSHLKTLYTIYNWSSKCGVLGKLHENPLGDYKNIQEFMTKICNMKCEIECRKIIMNEAIKIQVLNSLSSSFAEFLGILSHKTIEKKKLLPR